MSCLFLASCNYSNNLIAESSSLNEYEVEYVCTINFHYTENEIEKVKSSQFTFIELTDPSIKADWSKSYYTPFVPYDRINKNIEGIKNSNNELIETFHVSTTIFSYNEEIGTYVTTLSDKRLLKLTEYIAYRTWVEHDNSNFVPIFNVYEGGVTILL